MDRHAGLKGYCTGLMLPLSRKRVEHSLSPNALPPANPPGPKNTSPSAKFLRFPRITSLGAAQRAQRHVSDSITTIRYQLRFQLIERLGQCSCCGRQNVRQRL